MAVPPVDPQIQAILDLTADPFLHDPDSIFADPAGFAELRTPPDSPRDERVEVSDHVGFHSGGWVFGRPQTEEAKASRYAAEVDAVVVSVDYRLSPEDDRAQSPSAVECTDTPVLTRAALQRAWSYYGPDHAGDGYASPARAENVAALPPTMVIAEVDPLRDEGIGYAARLNNAGVNVELVQVPGAVHGFDLFFDKTDVGNRGLATQVRALREALVTDT